MKPTSDVLDPKTTSSGPGVPLIDGKKQCPDCGKFFNKAYLKIHHDAIHLKKQNLCHDCGMNFTFAGSLKCHQERTCKSKAKEVAELVQCKKCGKEMKEWSLAKHIKEVHTEGRVKCKKCGKEMKERNLARHIKQVHTDGRVKCKQCGKEIKEWYLAEHTKLIHNDGQVNCQQCGKQMKNKRTLGVHIKLVHANGPVKCEQCVKEMKNKKTLAEHFKSVHIKKSTLVKCDLCQKSLKKDSMKQHQAMHRRVFIKALRV